MNIILCEADTEHYCKDCAIDKRFCNYPNDDVRACDEFEEIGENMADWLANRFYNLYVKTKIRIFYDIAQKLWLS